MCRTVTNLIMVSDFEILDFIARSENCYLITMVKKWRRKYMYRYFNGAQWIWITHTNTGTKRVRKHYIMLDNLFIKVRRYWIHTNVIFPLT